MYSFLENRKHLFNFNSWNMKYFKIIIIACVSTLAFIACSNGDDKKEDIIVDGKTFQQSATLPASKADTTIILSDLKAAINSVKGGNEWLTVVKESYTSGSPKVRLTAKDNKEEKSRDCKVTITAESGDKVVLTVEQNGAEPKKTGIDDSHDIPTNQPAYSREI